MLETIDAKDRRVLGGLWTLVLASLLISVNVMGEVQRPREDEPDFTKGETTRERYTGKGNWNYCNLGSVGAIGEVWINRSAYHDRADAKQGHMIRVMQVLEGSPAEGILQVNDVILGIGDSKFAFNVRKEISAAITEAEKKQNGGELVLMIYRPEGDLKDGKGTVISVTVTVPVWGSYSDTAPWNCDKSKAIIDAACRQILKQGFFRQIDEGKPVPGGGIPGKLEALGLLATGEEKYLPIVKDYVRKLADFRKDASGRFSSWFASYDLLLLTEYYLATQDEYVLPAITNMAGMIALGASDVGTYSHGPAYTFTAHGKQWKYPASYGAMNQCSLTCALSLVLARKCGVRNDEVDRVIRKASYFYRWYVDKGAIPYGDHTPGRNYDDNGHNSQAAVLFDLLGDKESAEYYSRATLTSYNVREQGHTGHFFSFQWGALGAARAGDEAAQSFINKMQWFTELERRPDGGFKYQPQLSTVDHGHYRSYTTTGSRLLQFCLPRRKLYITGKGGSSFAPITGDELKETVALAEFDPKKRSVQELLKSLASWSPVIRRKASEELGRREENVVKNLITMLSSPNRYARYGACEGLSHAGRASEKAIDLLIKTLEKDDDLTLRYYAACAFRKQTSDNALFKTDEAMNKAIPALLKQVAVYEPEKDPLRKLHNIISGTLFARKGGLLPAGKGVENVDRTILIPAVKSLLINPNGWARSNCSSVFTRLTPDDLKQVWGDIYYATKYQAPSGSGAAGGVRAKGLRLMVENNVEEGIPVGIDWVLRQEGWGNGARKNNIPELLKYGNALTPFVAEIDTVLAGWTEANNSKNTQEDAKAFKSQLAEALQKPAPTLKSIKPYIDATPDPLLEDEK